MQGCPTIWRIYSYRSQEDRRSVQDDKARAEGWTEEAIGGGAREEWCYNCAKEGHLGDVRSPCITQASTCNMV